MEQANDETEILRKKAEENSVTIGRVIEGFGCSMEAYIKTMQAVYGRLPNDDERRAAIAMATGALESIGVKETLDLDPHNFIMVIISMWFTALANCGLDPENMEGAI